MGIAICAHLDGEPIAIAIAGPLERLARREAEFARILASTVERIAEIESPATF
jgi:hypothetical protein